MKYAAVHVIINSATSIIITIIFLPPISKIHQSERNAAQADFVKNIIRLDRTHNCHGVIVNHPKKQMQRGAEIDIFDMSGTSDMPNMADNVFIVQRVFDPTDEEPDGYLHLKKNKLNGKHSKMPLIFADETRNYLEYLNGEQVPMQLDWQNEGKQSGLPF